MKKHRLFSLFTALTMFASLASCAVPETTNTSKSAPAPKAQATAETTTDEVMKFVISDFKTSEDAIRLICNKVDGAAKYVIECKDGDDWEEIKTFSSFESNGFRVSGFDSNTSYTVRVTAKFNKRDKKNDISSEPVTVKTKSEKATTTYQEYVERSSPSWDEQDNYSYTTTKAMTQYVPPATSWEPTPYTGLIYYNTSTGVYHFPGCSYVDRISPENLGSCYGIPDGYRPCGHCT